jgi:tRNA dimethylallyltransferase
MLPRIDAANPRRLARAIEVMETSGRSLHAWQQETTEPFSPVFTAYWLQREKAELQTRIESRVNAMLAAGWIEEVRRLIAAHGVEKVRAFPAIGYRQIADLLAGDLTKEGAQRDITTATRRYAKRQLTWFARESTLRKMLLADSRLPEFPSN